jgi:large repetitive protein
MGSPGSADPWAAVTRSSPASAGSGTTAPGSVVQYTVTVTNSGQTAYTGATFTDPLSGVLDDASYDNDASATAGSVSFASPDLTWTGNLAVGASATVTFSVTVSNPDIGNKVLASTVTSTTPGSNCAAGSGGASCATTVPVAVLTITNTSDVSTATPGSVVRFTAVFTNAGQTPYTGITIASNITNVLDDATPNGDQTATTGTLTLTSTGISWTGSIPVGGTVTVTGTVTVNNPDAGNKLLASTLSTTAAGSNCPAGTTDPRCSVSVTVQIPALTITQTSNATHAVPGQQVGFTVTITDTGPTAYSGVTVTDTLQLLNDASYDNDASATAGSVSYASPVLTWTGDLAPGGTATITYSVTVNNPDTGDKVLAAAAASTAAGSSCPPASGSPGCNIAVPVLTPALTIIKTASTATATPGQQVTYTVTVTDSGQTPYTGATVTDPLSGVIDDAAYDNDAAATTGTVSYASPDLTWTGNLTPGQATTITYTVTVNNPDTGDHLLTSTLASTTPGSNCGTGSTDPRCATTTDIAGLTIVNTANVSTATPRSTIAYTITITDTGQTSYDGATVTDPLTGVTDDAAYDNDAATTVGSVAFASPDLTWTGDLTPGQAITVTFTVTVNNPDTGDKIVTSTLTSTAAASTCPPSAPAPACTSTVTVLIPALTLTKTATATTTTPGSAVGYTVTVTDTGPTPYTAATVTDSLDGVLGDAAYNHDAAATSGTVSYASPDLTWTGDLAPGQAVTITYTVTVDNPDTGDKRLVNFVTSTDAGSTCPSDSPSPACTATVTDLIPALTITKTATVAATTPGSTVGYTITVHDTGQTPYTAATVTDTLDGVLGDAAYNNNAAATSGTVSYASPVLAWTGNLAPGDSATIAYSVTVNNPDTGGTLSNTVVSAVPGSTCPAGATGPGCSVTVAIVAGPLSITAPATASLGSAAPGGNLSADLGTVQVTDDRGFGADWTATVSGTSFATGAGTPAETIPVTNAEYAITALGAATGSATFTPVPATQLSTSPQPVVNATNVAGNTTVTWDPTIDVSIPGNAVGGAYTATITHSVS